MAFIKDISLIIFELTYESSGGKVRIGICGAGPGGSVLARLLAEKGADVLLFDGTHPREKPCAGLVNGEEKLTLDFLDDFCGKVRFEGQRRYKTPGNTTFFVPKLENDQFYTVSREKMDLALAQKAEKVGARWIKENVVALEKKKRVWVISTPDKKEYIVDFICGADGSQSFTRNKIMGDFWDSHFLIGHGIRYPGLPIKNMYIYILKGGSFAFILPAPYGFQILFCSFGENKSSFSRIQDFVSKGLPKSIGNGIISRQGKPFAGIQLFPKSPRFFQQARTGSDHLFIGDAAGFNNSSTGEGISYAFYSAHLAAGALIMGKPLKYEEMWRESFGKDLIRASVKAKISPPDFLIDAGGLFLSKSPALCGLMRNVARGAYGIGDISQLGRSMVQIGKDYGEYLSDFFSRTKSVENDD